MNRHSFVWKLLSAIYQFSFIYSNASYLPRRQPLVMFVSPASLTARLFPLTPACRQDNTPTLSSLQNWTSSFITSAVRASIPHFTFYCKLNQFRKTMKHLSLLSGPRGLTFTWWGCYGLCPRHKPAELAHSFLYCSCVCFCLFGLFNCISFHKFSQQLSVFSLFFRSYLYLIGPFNYMSLYESLLQP